MSHIVLDVPDLLRRLGIEGEQRGHEIYALCPNPAHQDRNPSWRIRNEPSSTRHGKHKCWPCGFGGDATSLVIELLHLDYRAALAWIGSSASAKPIPSEVVFSVPRSMVGGMRVPDGVVQQPLNEWPSPPRDYVEERGITAAQVDRWRLGWAADGKLAGRIFIPTYSADGRLAVYTARSFSNQRRRYREPDEGAGEDRSVLFGEEFWPSLARRRSLRLFVMEGALNAMAVERALSGLGPYVGALNGSNFTPAAAVKLASWGEVVIPGDSDYAGERVGSEIANALVRHARVKFVPFAPGEDPNSVDPALLRTMLLESVA